jgi:hypothetical protein
MSRAAWSLVCTLVLWSGIAAADSTGSDTSAPAAPVSAEHINYELARKACTDAMNADPTFAQAIVHHAGDEEIVKVHEEAFEHVQKNEAHVIYAYAAIWVIAAAFLGYIAMRQRALKAEIATLRNDLEAAAKAGKS